MKILQVVSYFPPDRIGGVGEVAAHIHEGLLAEGHDSTVLTSGSSRTDPRIIRVGRSPGMFGLTSLKGWKLGRGVDVVHAHHGEALLFLVAARLRRARPRILVTMHIDNRKLGDSYRPVNIDGHRIGSGWSAWVQRRVKSRLKALLDRVAMKLADQVTFISRSAARDVLGATAGSQAVVVYNGLPPPAGQEVVAAESVELLYVGTEGVRKRTDLLPAILEGVRRQHPGARLRIVGFDLSVPLRTRFEERDLLDAVVCEGPVLSVELDRFYQAAAVLLVPSAYEGLPMVIMEGLRRGLPCVATEVGGAAEIIENGVNGFLVPRDDVAAMTEACVRLLAHPDRAAALGGAGRLKVPEAFSLDAQVLGYVTVYGGLLASDQLGDLS